MLIITQNLGTVQIYVCEKCFDISNERNDVCRICGSKLTKEYIEPEIIVPIDYSDVELDIPGGEPIIYSTIGSIEYESFSATYRWVSHLLMTPKGFVYSYPQEEDISRLLDLMKYISWLSINKLKVSPKEITFEFLLELKFRLVRGKATNFESEEEFRNWKSTFILKMFPFLINLRKNRIYCFENNIVIEEAKKNPEMHLARYIKRLAKELKTFEKIYEKERTKIK